MPTLTPTQRAAYDAFQGLWQTKGLNRTRAKQVFLALTKYEEVPYFMELTVPDAEAITQALRDDNVLAYLRAEGKATGICQVCGRELTDPKSIASGIGPVCEGRVGALGSLADLLS